MCGDQCTWRCTCIVVYAVAVPGQRFYLNTVARARFALLQISDRLNVAAKFSLYCTAFTSGYCPQSHLEFHAAALLSTSICTTQREHKSEQ